MNQSFKDRFNQSVSGNPETDEQRDTNLKTNAPDIEFYNHYSGIRNVCFTHLDGSRIFLNYNYLVSVEYNPDPSLILLSFTTHIITISGVNLEKLFDELMFHSVKNIGTRDQRYNHLAGAEATIVNGIEVKGF